MGAMSTGLEEIDGFVFTAHNIASCWSFSVGHIWWMG